MNVSAGILLLNGISVSGVTGGGTGVTQIIAGDNISVDQGTGVVTITGPNLNNYVSTSYAADKIGSTVIGLGTAGYISTAQFLSTTFSYSRAFTTLSANISTLFFSSATANTAYISSLTVDQLTFGDGNGWADFGAIRAAVVSSYQVNTGIVYAPIISTQQIVGVSFLTQASLTSTVIGLGTTGYLSSAITNLGGFGLVSTANLAGHVSTANLATLVSTAYLATQLGSTVIGLGTAGYLSSIPSLGGFVSTANLAGHVSTANLATLVSTSYLATQIGSTVIGLGTAGYLSSIPSLGGFISTANLAGHVSTANLANLVSTSYLNTALTSTVIGLGTAGYLSSIPSLGGFISTANLANLVSTSYLNTALTSTVIGLGTAGYLSSASGTINVSGLVSTANLVNLVSTANLANLISTSYLATQLGSTVRGLGTAGYLSSIPSLGGFVSTANLVNLVSTANLINLVSTANLANLISTNYLATQLASTVIGLGTAGYISSGQLLSTSVGLSQYISSFIDTTELTSTVIGLGTQGFVSSLGLTYAVASTAQGLGTFGYTSTSQLLSTSLGLYQEIQNSPANIKQSNVTSTIIGLGTVGYLSTVVFGSIVSTANLAGHVSTANLANLVSTANLAGHVSTANLTNLVSTANLANLVSTANLASLVSTSYLATQLTSTVIGLGTAGYISTQQLTSSFAGLSNVAVTKLIAGTGVSLSPASGVGNVTVTIQGVTTSIGNYGQNTVGQQITVTTAGPFPYTIVSATITTGGNPVQIIATGDANNVTASTWCILQLYRGTTALGGQVQAESSAANENIPFGITWVDAVPAGTYTYSLKTNNVAGGSFQFGEATSPVISLVEIAGASPGYLSSISLFSTVAGLGTAGYLSSVSLYSTVAGLGTAGYLSSIPSFGGFVSTANLVGLVSTSYLNTSLTSTVIGLGTAGYLSSIPSLGGFISTANLANLVSTANLAGHVSTANLANLVSTTYIATQLGSTVIGLGTAGYLSSIPSLGGFVSTANLANLVSTSYLATQIGSTVIGLGTAGYISSSQFLSTTFSYSRAFRTLSANISTLFFSSATANTAYISSLTIDQLTFGDGNGWADFGAIRAAVVSSYQVNTGIIYAPIVSTSLIVGVSFLTQANLTSTVIGLGTVGYLSSALTNIGGFGLVSTANLANLVSTANLAGHISTANLAGLVSTANLVNLVSTSYLQTQLGSTVIGLGTVGYLSTQISSFLTLSTGNLITSSITFNSPSSAPVGNNVFVSSSLFFFNQFVIGGTRVQQPQIFTF